MRLTVPYGERRIPLNVPEAHWGELLEPPRTPAIPFTEGLTEALAHPLSSPPLEEFLQGCRSLLLVINDETRPTPSGKVLETLYPLLAGRLTQVLVATGTHGAGTEEGCAGMLGKFWPLLKPLTSFHDCRQEKGMVYLGETSRGTKVRINSGVMMADRVLVIGSVEPHYFAGYTGGRKSIVPGLAAYSTIVANHSLALEGGARPLALEGNPVHEDLEEAAALLTVPPVFSVMLVLNPERGLYAACAGSLTDTLRQSARKADEVYTIPFRHRAEIVVSVVFPPLDRDLYQSQKPIEHGKMALTEDGILILVTACPRGAGNLEFQELLVEAGQPNKMRSLLSGPYALGHHRLLRNLKFLEQGGQVWAVTDLDPVFLSKTFIRPKPSLQEALDQALKMKGKNARVNILLDAGHFVPRAIKENELF